MALIRLCVCAGWSEPLLVAQTTLLEIPCHGSFLFLWKDFQQKFIITFWFYLVGKGSSNCIEMPVIFFNIWFLYVRSFEIFLPCQSTTVADQRYNGILLHFHEKWGMIFHLNHLCTHRLPDNIKPYLLHANFACLASLCSWAGWFEPYLGTNSKKQSFSQTRPISHQVAATENSLNNQRPSIKNRKKQCFWLPFVSRQTSNGN